MGFNSAFKGLILLLWKRMKYPNLRWLVPHQKSQTRQVPSQITCLLSIFQVSRHRPVHWVTRTWNIGAICNFIHINLVWGICFGVSDPLFDPFCWAEVNLWNICQLTLFDFPSYILVHKPFGQLNLELYVMHTRHARTPRKEKLQIEL
jgi:hypothetical protein